MLELNNKRVRVYWNLHKKCWSVQDTKTNRVVDHTFALNLVDATFKVQQGGKKRVRSQGRKNVHAFVVGTVDVKKPMAGSHNGAVKVTYNPYKHDTFVEVYSETEKPVTSASIVTLGTYGGVPSVWAIVNNPKSDDGLQQPTEGVIL